MKPLTQKVLESGLIDKHMAQMLEKWGNLPEGSAELVKDDALRNATKEQLTKLGEELGDEVEKLRALKETQLDLDQLRWPTTASIRDGNGEYKAIDLSAVIDRMGRLYFRHQDVDAAWFVPGFTIERWSVHKGSTGKELLKEQILEVTPLFIDELPVCFQVTVHRVA